jgi:hypothetical protein
VIHADLGARIQEKACVLRACVVGSLTAVHDFGLFVVFQGFFRRFQNKSDLQRVTQLPAYDISRPPAMMAERYMKEPFIGT